MLNFIPIFPLNIVVYPGEQLNLHIFEPRYKQLVKECLAAKKPFGIPPVLKSSIEEYGTLMEIAELANEYANGELDIRTVGVSVFRVLEVVKTIPDKLYHGAIVDNPENVMEPGDTGIAKVIVNEVRKLYTLMNLEEKFPADRTSMISYQLAHYVGLTLEQEYELLCIFTEVQRLEYLRRHLNNMLPTISELEHLKERIQMNGHFRNLSLDDLNI